MSGELFDEVEFINKHINFKNPNVNKKLNKDDKNKVVQLLIICKKKIEINKEYTESYINNYIKSLKIAIFYIPFNPSIKEIITENKTYEQLFLGRSFINSSSNLLKEKSNNINDLNGNDTKICGQSKWNNTVSLYDQINKYELIFLINLITHNENNNKVWEYLYPWYFYYIILNELEQDNIFMLLNNFILNKITYDKLAKDDNIAFVLFISLFNNLKNIKNEAAICNYFYFFIENCLKHENKLFIHILQHMKLLYTYFECLTKEMKENVKDIYNENITISEKWKIFNNVNNKNYVLKYIIFMYRLIFEALYNIMDQKNFEIEPVSQYKELYKIIIEEIHYNLIFINEINYFHNVTDVCINLYNKYVLFMDMFLHYKKNNNLEIFKLILFISNIFIDSYEQLDYLSYSEKKNYIDTIFIYLKNIHNMRNEHISKKENILYHNFVLNRYIISIVANFSVDGQISAYIKEIQGIDILRKFMYVDDKDPCLAEYSVLAIKHIKENENLDDL
ncbi:conserved Plasmodium protein, unknown function [Plasmodium vinckei brucechwatti]|uniref:Uncharacterized protein n=1 Tax=Plasmodium vinckei brucechwatti TaxID=119398 RepID=A0A6V7SPE4_PLAVN|nr:conserved Plasmodium protein, unknown function [Plasmodium vinckei brucechwatti]